MIFLTGGSGFLGSSILKNLAGAGLKARCAGRRPIAVSQDVEWVRMDLNDSRFPDDLLDGCSHVLHCAGLIKGSGRAHERVNYLATRKLLELARTAKIKKFVFISSIDAVLFDSAYAKSKKMAEEAIRGSGLNWVIIRPPQIFGPNDSKNFSALNKLVAMMPIIPLPYGGRFEWEPVFVEDLAAFAIDATMDERVSKETFNIAGPQVMRFREIINVLEEFNKVRRIKISVPAGVMNLCRGFTRAALGKGAADNIFLTFRDKLAGEDSAAKKIRLNTRFSYVYKAEAPK